MLIHFQTKIAIPFRIHSDLLSEKLAERMAFERITARLYEALIVKIQASELRDATPDLERIRNQELEHFDLLEQTMELIGADPTQTQYLPGHSSFLSNGQLFVITDPNSSLLQSLQATLMVELADTAGWEFLIELTREAELHSIQELCEHARREEAEHLLVIKSLLKRASMERIHHRAS